VYFLYLDESGDLGFDFTKSKTSRFFVITILLLKSPVDDECFRRAVKRTIKNKLCSSRKPGSTRSHFELKGSNTEEGIKRYFWEHVKGIEFELYAFVLRKELVDQHLKQNPEQLYNHISRMLIEKIGLQRRYLSKVNLIIDKSKSRKEIRAFNQSIEDSLSGLLCDGCALSIHHYISQENLMLQAVDLFCWGIFRKYEREDSAFYENYQEKIVCEELFSP
jgi:hypothetical protein